MRVALAVALVFSSASPFRIPAWISFALVSGVLVLSYIELNRRHERNLLHNLGMPVLLIVAISAVPAVVAESAFRLIGSMSR